MCEMEVEIKTEKEEKPLIKSSAEILSELFSSFNAQPPELDDDTQDKKKHKKSKKKHKKKHKKKRKKTSSNDESSEPETKKSKKKKRDSSSDSSSDSKRKKVETVIDFKTMYLAITEDLKANLTKEIKTEPDSVTIKQEKDLPDSTTEDKPKAEKPKIKIQDLKDSLTFKDAVGKNRVEDLEEGELSDYKKRSKRRKAEDDLNLTESTDDETRIKRRKKRKHSRHRSKERHKHSSREKSSEKRPSSIHKEHRRKSREYSRERDSAKSKAKSWYDYDEESRHRSVKDRLDYKRGPSSSYDHYSSKRSYYHEKSRHRSRSRSSSPRTQFDKKKLLEIARKNAILMLKNGSLPGYVGLGPQAQEKVLAVIKTGGKTIDELTDFCKNLSREEALGDLSSVSDGNESDTDKPFNHPFQLKERSSGIIMNIPNATQIPNKTPQEQALDKSSLLMQFPVSSGQHHRKTENQWIPVPPKKDEAIPKVKSITKSFVEPAGNKQLQTIKPVQNQPLAIMPAPPQVIAPPVQPVFPAPVESLDIGSIVSQRLMAMRKLQENPNDMQAIGEMSRAQNEMQNWAASKQIPGQFTGSTGVQTLSVAELSSGFQAWARKDQLVTATPVSGGMGMHLLQKMGWRPGEGLGKEKNGALQPLMLEVKLDKKGLVADEEVKGKRQAGKNKMPVKTLDNKHPVSLLGEYACKRKLGPPVYELCFECGPSHKKNFLFKVKVNGVEYQPSVASPNKKQAKADAATVCLQQLGVLPS